MTTRHKLKKMRKKSLRLEMMLEGKNRHHIIPASREGTDSESNIVYVDVEKHAKYHHLFGNMTPDEIVSYLVSYFWKGNFGYVFEAIANSKEVQNEQQNYQLEQK